MRAGAQSRPKQEASSPHPTRNPDSTKRSFLLEQIRFLEQFKEQSQVLNQLAHPSPSPQTQLPKLLAKMQRVFTKNLNEQIVYIRREVSFERISDETAVHSRFAQNYEERIEEYNGRLERMEGIVQATEDKKRKNKEKQLSGEAVLFRAVASSSAMEESVRQREGVKKALRAKLKLSGALAKLWEREASQLTLSKEGGHCYATYHFLASHQQHYRSKSSDSWAKLPEERGRSVAKGREKGRPIPNFYLRQLQQQIFEEELCRMRSHNSKLQLSISLLKAASAQRQEEKILRELTGRGGLEMEESIAREVFAYQKLGARFQERLENCSFKWMQELGRRREGSRKDDWEWRLGAGKGRGRGGGGGRCRSGGREGGEWAGEKKGSKATNSSQPLA